MADRFIPPPSISVIVPVRNEMHLKARIDQLREILPRVQILVVDSSDKSIFSSADVVNFDYIYDSTLATRAEAMNLGASQAKGNYLWFLHSDCHPSPRLINALTTELKNSPGALVFFKRYAPSSHLLSIQGTVLNQLARLKRWCLVGTNGLLIRKDLFESLNGFPVASLFEDVLMFDKLREECELNVIPVPLTVSSRRYSTGRAERIVRNFLIYAAFRLGISPERLARIYRA